MTPRAGSGPRVVACMPAWNAAGFIAPVLDSLAAQTYRNLQILISVDTCADGTAELCEAFAAGHAHVRVLRQPARLGWIGNSNALLAAAEGDCAFFAFHDDPLRPTYVARLVEALETHPDAVLAFCDIESNIGPFSYRELDGVTDRYERARRILLQLGPWWVPNRGLFRLPAARQLGGVQRHLAGEYGADWPWLLRLALLGMFVRVPQSLLHKTFRPESLSATWRKGLWRRLALRLACLSVIRQAGFPWRQTVELHRARLWLWLMEEWWQLARRRGTSLTQR